MKCSLILLLVVCFSMVSLAAEKFFIIPRPHTVETHSDHFIIDKKTQIVLRSEAGDLQQLAETLKEKIDRATGYGLEIAKEQSPEKLHNVIVLTHATKKKNLGSEGYEIDVTRDRVTIAASQAAGVFYAIQSLYQMMPPEIEGTAMAQGVSWKIPCARIEDMPRFSWRGMHLDVGRHFRQKEFVKKYLDLLAMYKINTFHWHLTEDQGWRIEIKNYPRLTEIGAWRKESMDDNTPHGGFYRQDDIREIVKYAKKRFITIVPEIEMPGHCLAALAAHPELSCSGGPFKVGTEWGVIHDVYCAGNEKTFQFLEDVLTEVIGLFPGEVIHIGGDEVPKTRWKNCFKCQTRIKEEGLKDESELQSYFIKRIERFLNSKGKRIIGWDEILEGGVAPNASVMSWRGMQGGIEAAKAGHDVVMTPTSHCYFDYYQGKYGEPRAVGGFLPIDTIYSYEPVPVELTSEEARHILGAQGNMWSEYMPTDRHVEYMLMPRLCALSEVVWSQKDKKNYRDFTQRLENHYDRLAAKDVNFRVPPPLGVGGRAVIFRDTVATLASPVATGRVTYSLDENDTTVASQVYSKPIRITGTTTLKARTLLKNGRMSNIVSKLFMRVDPRVNGVRYSYYEGTWNQLPDFNQLTPLQSGWVYDIGLDGIPYRGDQFAVRMSAVIKIEREGEYTFYTISDDGSKLYLDDTLVVNNDAGHTASDRGGTITLKAGKHPIAIEYFEIGGDQYLDAEYEGPGISKRPIPAYILLKEQAK